MSVITDLLMEKAASFRKLASEVSEPAKPAKATNVDDVSWEQVKQAAVTKIVSETDLDEATASALIDELGGKLGEK